MKLYLKQKAFFWKEFFTVKDETGEDKYYVVGKIASLGKKLTVTDRLGMEVAYIHQKAFSLLPRFFVDVNGRTVAEIVKPFSFLRPNYEVRGLGWTVEGSVTGHDYTVFAADGSPVVSIHKKWMSWGDAYEMELADGAPEAAALAVVLAIDAVLDSAAAAAAVAAN